MVRGNIHNAIPIKVLNSIKEHLRTFSEKGETGWRSAQRSEDTLTGHWGGAVQVGWSKPVEDSGYIWRWRIDYRKFGGGNQKYSEEQPTGSDGIIQIEVDRFKVASTPLSPGIFAIENIELEASYRKGMLFQAKRSDSTERERLVGQLQAIEKLAPGDGGYFEFGPDQYRAASAKSVSDVDGFTKKLSEDEFKRLGDFLSDEFLECKIGVEGLYVDFDSEPQELHFPEMTPEVARVQNELKHGLRVKVSGNRIVPFERG